MKHPNEDKYLYWPLAVLLSAVAVIFGFFTGYDIAHQKGYAKGVGDGRLYNEATGTWPTKDWIDTHRADHFYTPQDILKTLEPYSGGK